MVVVSVLTVVGREVVVGVLVVVSVVAVVGREVVVGVVKMVDALTVVEGAEVGEDETVDGADVVPGWMLRSRST